MRAATAVVSAQTVANVVGATAAVVVVAAVTVRKVASMGESMGVWKVAARIAMKAVRKAETMSALNAATMFAARNNATMSRVVNSAMSSEVSNVARAKNSASHAHHVSYASLVKAAAPSVRAVNATPSNAHRWMPQSKI